MSTNNPSGDDFPWGASLLGKSKANPGNVDMSIFAKKTSGAGGGASKGPLGQGTVSSDYLKKCREEDPWPEAATEAATSVKLSNCRFLTPPENLHAGEECEIGVDLSGSESLSPLSVSFSIGNHLLKNGKEERSTTWNGIASRKTNENGQTTAIAKALLTPEIGNSPGGKLKFDIEARHPNAKEPLKSLIAEVDYKTVAHWMGGDDLQFETDSAFPRLGSDALLIRVLANATKRFEKPVRERETVICFGFASSAGSADQNRKLSLDRAKAVKAILSRDEATWETLATTRFSTKDIQQFLSDLHTAFGWECDPGTVDGAVGPKTKAAIESFQRECNVRFGSGLKEDGLCGPKTWKAVLRTIIGEIAVNLGHDKSKEPTWKDANWGNAGKGVYGNGVDFATCGDKPEERSVQITFFAPGSERKLKDPSEGQKTTTKDNPIQDESQVVKKKIPTLEELLSAPKTGPVIHVGFFFDGTDNNRDRDRPKGHDTNVSKLYDLYDHDDKTRFKSYFEGVATGDWKTSD